MTTLAQLASDLTRAPAKMQAASRPIIARTALETKTRMVAEAGGHRHPVARAINYDLTNGGMGFECGPRKGYAGSLAFYYFGNSKTNATIPDPIVILRDEADKAIDFMAIAALNAVLS